MLYTLINYDILIINIYFSHELLEVHRSYLLFTTNIT